MNFEAATPAYRGYLDRARRRSNLYRAQDLDTGTRLPGRGPVFAVSLRALKYAAPPSSRFDGFKIAAQTQGPQEAPDPYLSPIYAVYQPSSFTTVNADVGYRVGSRLLVVLRGYNLGDDRYAVYAGYPMPGRSVTVEMRSR